MPEFKSHWINTDLYYSTFLFLGKSLLLHTNFKLSMRLQLGHLVSLNQKNAVAFVMPPHSSYIDMRIG